MEDFPVKVNKDGKIFCHCEECRVGQLIKKSMFDKCNGEECPLAKLVRVTALCVGQAINAQFNDNMKDFAIQFNDLIDIDNDGTTDISEQQKH